MHAARSVMGASDAETTVVMPSEGTAAPEGATGDGSDAPSETSERLSEGVQDLREKAEALIAGLDALEGRLEAAEMEQLALKEDLRRAELEAERARSAGTGEQPGQRGPARRGWMGGR